MQLSYYCYATKQWRSPKREVNSKLYSLTGFFPTIPWLLVSSRTLPWQISNSLTFPTLTDKWSSWIKCNNILLLATFWWSWRIVGRIFKNVQEDWFKFFKRHHWYGKVALQSFDLVSKFLRQTRHVSPLLHFLEKLYQTNMSQRRIDIQRIYNNQIVISSFNRIYLWPCK